MIDVATLGNNELMICYHVAKEEKNKDWIENQELILCLISSKKIVFNKFPWKIFIVGVKGQGAHIYVYVGPRAQFKGEPLLG